jgi:hypothetical protein
VRRTLLLLFVWAAASLAADSTTTPPGCIGSAPLGKFRVSVARPDQVVTLPITELTAIPEGSRLIWDPVHLSSRLSPDSEVAALIVPRKRGELEVLPAKKAAQGETWDLPHGAEVVALVIGPDGLNMGKVKSLVKKNEDLLPELAAYAQQTSQVEALVQTLADSETTGGGAEAALRGFSSRWGVAMPKLDPNAPTNQQANTLLSAILPSASAYDPLAPRGAQMQQTTGLAASIAGLFFGNTVGLAAGGAALVTNLKSGLFPNTEFRSAYSQAADAGVMAFCAKNQPKSRTKLAYLWAYRAPGTTAPKTEISGPAYLPLGAKSPVKVGAAKDLGRARDWRLVPAAGGDAVPVLVTPGADSVEVDLTKTALAAGEYRLTANWDWETIAVGTVHLQPFGDLSKAVLPATSRDKLVQGSGTVTVELTGADFEFVDKVEVQKVAPRPPKPVTAFFELPKGPRTGPQTTMKVDIDTATAGEYKLLLAQDGGAAQALPVTVLPPNPSLSKLPVRVNIGESEQTLHFEGSGLDRVESMTSEAGEIAGGKLRLKSAAKPGDRFAIALKVRGLEAPLVVPNAIEVVGPRPKIVSARRSAAADTGIELREDELPAGMSVGFAIAVDHLRDPGSERPRLELGCRGGETRRALAISPDEKNEGASLTFDGGDSLYLSLDPGTVGFAGCELTATVTVAPRGASDAYALGRVVRAPVVEQFTLTNETAGPERYVGVLRGRDLDLVEKAGWDAQNGVAVPGIPAPVSPTQQSLRIVVPWPAPAPHAPLYIWMRGEKTGRRTKLAE